MPNQTDLRRGGYIISNEDADLRDFHWAFDKSVGYYFRIIEGKKVYLHQVVLARMGFKTNKNMQSDHINQIKIDNRRINLRAVPRYLNQRNKGVYKNNKTGFIGVSFEKARNKFMACITVAGKPIKLGRFLTAELAHKAYLIAKGKYHA